MAGADSRGRPAPPSVEAPIRAAEVVGALSLATDLGTGQPLEHALRTAVIAVRLGELSGASQQELVDTYYAALLHSSGCTSDGHEAAQLYGDDIAPRAAFALVDAGNVSEIVEYLQSTVGLHRTDEERAVMIEQAILHGLDMARQTFAMHCEVAQRFAAWLGFSEGTRDALAHVFERWDGHGFPGVTSGEAIPLPMRILHIARDVSVFLRAAGPDEARLVVENRSGSAYDSRLAGLALQHLDGILAEIDDTRIWEQALEVEPFPQIRIAGERVDAAFVAIAAFTDLKQRPGCASTRPVSPISPRPLPGVSTCPPRRSRCFAVPRSPTTSAVSASSNAIWEKPGGLGFGEWERVRLHPHFTERAFAQSPALAPIGLLAGSHHERLDGSGYQRGTRGAGVSTGRRGSSRLPTATPRCVRRAPTGPRSMPRRPRRS